MTIINRATTACRKLWCEKHNVDYCIGLAKNSRLNRQVASLEEQMKLCYEQSHEPQRQFMDFS